MTSPSPAAPARPRRSTPPPGLAPAPRGASAAHRWALVSVAALIVTAGAARAEAPDLGARALQMARDLREAVRPDDLRIGNVARELAALSDEVDDTLLDLATDPSPAVRRAALRALATRAARSNMPAFVQAMADDAPQVVIEAAHALKKYQGEWPTQALVRYLGHPDAKVREAVLDALEGRDAKLITGVIKGLLKTPPPGVGRGPFLTALGRFPDRKALKTLLKALDDPSVSAAAAKGLAYLGPKAAKGVAAWLIKRSAAQPETARTLTTTLAGYGPAGEKLLQKIIVKAPLETKRAALALLARKAPKTAARLVTALAGHRDAQVKRVALELLPKIPGADPLPSLPKNLEYKSQDVRILALRALVRRDKPNSELQRLLITHYRQLARKRTPANLTERGEVLRALGRVGDADATSELIAALGRDDEAPAAIDGLGLMGAPAVKNLLFLIKTGDDRRRPRAVRALAKVGAPAVQDMIRLLVHPARDVRLVARKALAGMGSPLIVAPVAKLIEDQRTPGRVQLVALLGKIHSPESYQALRRLAAQSYDHTLRIAAIRALRLQPTPQVIEFFRGVAAEDDSHEARQWAVQTLIEQGDTRSLPLLKKMLGYEKPHIREVAAFGVGYMGQPSDVPAVVKDLSSPRPSVVTAIRNALRRIVFRPEMKAPEQFLAWYKRFREVKPPKRAYKHGEMTLSDGTVVPYWLGGNGKPLLVLHGGPDWDHRYLQRALDVLYPTHLLLFIDLPGRGESKRPADADAAPHGVAGDAAAAAMVLARLNFRDIDVLGHGWGALVAARLAQRHPKLVRRLVLDQAPVPTRAGWQAQQVAAAAAAPPPWSQDIKLLQRASGAFAPAVRDRMLRLALLTGQLAKPGVLVYLAPLLKPHAALREAYFQAMGAWDLSDLLDELAKPTLLVYGDKSVTPKDWAQGLARASDKVQLKVIPGAGLFPGLENATAYREAVDGFLAD